MVKKLILILLVFFDGSTISSQTSEIEEKINRFQSGLETVDANQKRFLTDKKFHIGTEVLVLPLNKFIFQNSVSTLKNYGFSRPVTIGIASFTYEPRYNLKVLTSKRSLFVRVPLSLSFSVTTKGFYVRSAGFFHASGAFLLGLGQKLGSTRRNIESKGSAVSLGFQYLRAPLLGHKIIQTVEYFNGTTIDTRKNWLLPVLQVDLYRINKNDKIRGGYFMVGLYKAFYFKFGFII